VPSMVNVGVVDSPPIWVKLSVTVIFFSYYLARGHSRRRALDLHILYINRCGFAKDVPFEGFNAEKLYLGQLFP
jgi:hypothetical protein